MSFEPNESADINTLLQQVLAELTEIKATLATLSPTDPVADPIAPPAFAATPSPVISSPPTSAGPASDLFARLQRVKEALAEGDFDKADRMASPTLQHDFPDEYVQLRHQIEQGKKGRLQAAIHTGEKKVSDLMGAGNFAQAKKAAQELKREYPQVPEAAGLLGRVQREAKTYEGEQRQRYLGIIREHGEAREWSKALPVAYKLMEEFPDSPEAAEVRLFMPTLVDNTRLEEVREYRNRIADLIQRNRYAEVIDISRAVIQNYPETAAAEELRAALPKFVELAQQNPD